MQHNLIYKCVIYLYSYENKNWWQPWFQPPVMLYYLNDIDGLVQDCSTSIANALELP